MTVADESDEEAKRWQATDAIAPAAGAAASVGANLAGVPGPWAAAIGVGTTQLALAVQAAGTRRVKGLLDQLRRPWEGVEDPEAEC